MAQWLGQFSGNTPATAVEDAEGLLRNAASALANEADPDEQRKKAGTAHGLALPQSWRSSPSQVVAIRSLGTRHNRPGHRLRSSRRCR